VAIMSSTGRRRLPHAQRRMEILAAAGAMFRARGYDAASIDAIAAEVGISGPAIYRYFSRKPEILTALIEAASADAVSTIDLAVSGSHGDDALTGLANALVDHAGRQGDVLALLQSGVAQLEADDRQQLHRIREDIVEHLGAALKRARPDLPAESAKLHADTALGVVGHMSDALLKDDALLDRFRVIVRAVLAA
jgi:AcrR family transcriptional regulator